MFKNNVFYVWVCALFPTSTSKIHISLYSLNKNDNPLFYVRYRNYPKSPATALYTVVESN